jgi:BlaI family transcriptional regulator, penicillinase repressor
MSGMRLTPYELEIMDVVWSVGEATVQDVVDRLKKVRAYTTVMTTLSLLEKKKKVLSRTKVGQAYVYRPVISREAVSRDMVGELRDLLFAGSTSDLMLNLVNSGHLSSDEIGALKSALIKLEADAESR